MYVVGVTGGVGSGKSTAVRRLAELGADVVDADAIARDVVEPGQPALTEIAARFPDVVDADGQLDRRALAAIVFQDASARADLEAITHPRIHARINTILAGLRDVPRPDGQPRVVVLEHPLLVEAGQAARCDAVVVIEAAEDVRVQRLVEGRGFDAGDARARIASQLSDDERRAAATHVLDNHGDVADLRAQVDALWTDLVAAARADEPSSDPAGAA